MQIEKATIQDSSAIIHLAKETWQHTYSSFIPQEQISYMLNRFYAQELIEEQIQDDQHLVFTAKEDGKLLGYCHGMLEKQNIKLSKLYIHPSTQGRGVGKQLLEKIEAFCKENNIDFILLNVNIHNPAQHFYKKMGFSVRQRVDISLHTFWLNDYVMEKKIG